MSVYKLENMSLFFGGIKANQNISFEIEEGKLYGLIGPNGAGKSTIFNVLTGVYRPSLGNVYLNNQSIIGKKSFELAQLGVGRTFQNIRLFKEQTVSENVLASFYSKTKSGLLNSIFKTKKYDQEHDGQIHIVNELLDFMGIYDLRHELAGSLPYGKQRKLEIARALALSPKVLLLDEPAAGLNPAETQELTQLIKKMQVEKNITVLLIEHDMRLVMDICEYIYVLDHGELIAQGNPHSIQNNPKVIEAYLGVD